MKQKKGSSCKMAYRQCRYRDSCNSPCRDPAKHPECDQYLACGYDDIYCDGSCEKHKLTKELNTKKLMRISVCNAKCELEHVHRVLEEEIKQLEDKIKEM